MTQKFPLTNWSEKKAFTIKLGAVKKYHIAVFADPNCPWCKRFFEENMDKLNDLEVFVYLAPVLGEDSEKLAAEILSEKDPAAAWTDWVMNENRPKVKATEEAKNIVEDNMELLEKLGIETVPAIYLADGEGTYGFMTAMELISKIEQEGEKEDEGKEPKEL